MKGVFIYYHITINETTTWSGKSCPLRCILMKISKAWKVVWLDPMFWWGLRTFKKLKMMSFFGLFVYINSASREKESKWVLLNVGDINVNILTKKKTLILSTWKSTWYRNMYCWRLCTILGLSSLSWSTCGFGWMLRLFNDHSIIWKCLWRSW